MNEAISQSAAPVRIERLKVRNFRALHEIEFKDLTPMTALLGPNGSGKSTVFDVFAFLAECFETGLRSAWDSRGRARELKTRGSDGPVIIEIKYRERPKTPIITYHLAVDERDGAPVVIHEYLQWKRGSRGQPFAFLDYREGTGTVIGGETPETEAEIKAEVKEIPLQASDLLAVNALGQFKEHPRAAALRNFIKGWHMSCFSTDSARGQPEAGPQEQLSRTCNNLANVIQHLNEHHPQRLETIFTLLRQRVPCIEKTLVEAMPDGRLLLQIKDAPFIHPVPARFASDGTLEMLAYLTLLHNPKPSPFIGIETPENFLHPRLLPLLTEECRTASQHAQLLLTTHSPFFIDELKPEEVCVLWRDEYGYTKTQRVADVRGVPEFLQEGAKLGELWMEGHFHVGDPLTRQGAPNL